MFKLIELPYALDALAPVISARTLEFHYGKHLQAYVDNLNKLLPGSGLEDKPLEEIIVKASSLPVPTSSSLPSPTSSSLPAPTGNLKAIFNNAGQVLNHNLYFTQFKTPDSVEDGGRKQDKGEGQSSCPAPTFLSCPAPTGHLKEQIVRQWGSLDAFKSDFEAKGVGLFGSGWVWLQADAEGKLSIGQYTNADNPVAHGLKPLLTFDVWEHAYYLDYQNRRAAHLQALWQILDWEVIEGRYSE